MRVEKEEYTHTLYMLERWKEKNEKSNEYMRNFPKAEVVA